MIVGTEWLIEADECDPEKLRDEDKLRGIFAHIIQDLDLKVVNEIWHTFSGEAGVTGLALLTESHLACHTYPENRVATFNLYCCRTRPEWSWESNLKEMIGAQSVHVIKIERGDRRPETPRSDMGDPRFRVVGGEQ